MRTQLLDQSATHDAPEEAKTPRAQAGGGRGSPASKLRWALRPLTRGRKGNAADIVWAVLVRSVVLVADYLLVSATATVVIPMLGAWLHQQSGAAHGELTAAGTIAIWLMPLAFLVIVLAAGEIAVMRGMWRGGGQMIARARSRRATNREDAAPPAVSGSLPAPGQKKNGKKRST